MRCELRTFGENLKYCDLSSFGMFQFLGAATHESENCEKEDDGECDLRGGKARTQQGISWQRLKGVYAISGQEIGRSLF